MKLKFVILNIEKTFGNLEFAGEDKVIQRRINGQLTVLSKSYNLYSDIQRAKGHKIGTRGFTNYILEANDMIKA